MSVNSLSIDLQSNPTHKDTLAESWGKVFQNFEKTKISAMYKNSDLSGDPSAGVLNAKRFANAVIADYGTARGIGYGKKTNALPVAISINDDKEFIEEVEEKDLRLYGIPGLIEKRTLAQQSAMGRYYERKFFKTGALAGTVHTFSASNINEKVEELIQSLETLKNDFVDGVNREDMVLVCRPYYYGLIRDYLDSKQNANVDTGAAEFGYFHGVVTHSSTYLPETVDMFLFVKGSIAQPIIQNISNPSAIPLSEASAFGMFLHSGTTAVAPDLIFYTGTNGSVTATSTAAAGGETTKTVITVTSTLTDAANAFYYLSGATAVAAPAYGTAVGETWTKLVLTEGAQKLTTGADTKIRVAEADASGKIIKVSGELTIVNGK